MTVEMTHGGVDYSFERYKNGDLKLNGFITHTIGLNKFSDAIDLIHEGKSIRLVIQLSA